jgi:hypothetical protein
VEEGAGAEAGWLGGGGGGGVEVAEVAFRGGEGGVRMAIYGGVAGRGGGGEEGVAERERGDGAMGSCGGRMAAMGQSETRTVQMMNLGHWRH